MNIPFYRLVENMDDGHDLYECLKCGKRIDVGDSPFLPRFCCYCGIEYKGAIPPKQTDWVYPAPSTKKLWFQVESAYDWGEEAELIWNDVSGTGTNNPLQAVKLLKEARAEREEENERTIKGGWKFRIITTKKEKSHEYIIIDTDKYYQRTGKKFNREIYNKR